MKPMAEQIKKKLGIYKLLSGMEIVSNPIYTGPKRKDLVLDIDQHNKVITRLLNKPKDEPLSPTEEKCQWNPQKCEKPWMNLQALRVLQTCFILSGYFLLALMFVLFINSTRDMKAITGSKSSVDFYPLLLAGTGAAVCGAFISGFLVRLTNKWLLLSFTMFLMGGSSLALPFCQGISAVIIITVLYGLSIGLYDSGANLSLVNMWGRYHESWLQAAQFCYAMGLILAHWLLEPYFKLHHGRNPLSESVHRFKPNIPNKQFLFIIGKSDGSKSQQRIDWEGTVVNTGYDKEITDNVGEIPSINLNVGYTFVLTSIPIFLIAFSFLIMAFYIFLRKKVEKIDYTKDEVEKLKDCEREKKTFDITTGIYSLLMLLFLTITCWMEFSFGKYIFGYSFHILGFSAPHAKAVSLVYWISLGFGTLCGIGIIKYLKPQTFIAFSLALLTLTFIPWCLINKCQSLFWVVSSFLGLSTSCIFSSGVSWIYENTGLPHLLGSAIMVARVLGVMLGSGMTEITFDFFGLEKYLYVTIVLTAVLCLFFAIIHLVVCIAKSRPYRGSEHDIKFNTKSKEQVPTEECKWLHMASY